MEITSINNDKVKYWEKLKQKKYRDIEKLFMVEDEHLVSEALNHNLVKEIITIDKKEYPCNTYYVTESIMKKISTQVTGAKIIAVCHQIDKSELRDKIIVLDRLQDPGNLGTIIRSAVAFNFNTIVLSNDTVDIYNPKVVRSSEGMIFNINIIRCDIKEFLKNLDKSYLKVTTNVETGEDIRNIKIDKCALVIGNEGSGVSKEVASLCDKTVKINMNSNCESLNASVSASILMYEVENG